MPRLVMPKKNRSDLIKEALRCLKSPTTRRVQEWVKKHYGVKVIQPLVCQVRKRLISDPAKYKAYVTNTRLKLVVKAFGGVDELISYLQEVKKTGLPMGKDFCSSKKKKD